MKALRMRSVLMVLQDYETGKQRRLGKLSFVGHSIGMPNCHGCHLAVVALSCPHHLEALGMILPHGIHSSFCPYAMLLWLQ